MSDTPNEQHRPRASLRGKGREILLGAASAETAPEAPAPSPPLDADLAMPPEPVATGEAAFDWVAAPEFAKMVTAPSPPEGVDEAAEIGEAPPDEVAAVEGAPPVDWVAAPELAKLLASPAPPDALAVEDEAEEGEALPLPEGKAPPDAESLRYVPAPELEALVPDAPETLSPAYSIFAPEETHGADQFLLDEDEAVAVAVQVEDRAATGDELAEGTLADEGAAPVVADVERPLGVDQSPEAVEVAVEGDMAAGEEALTPAVRPPGADLPPANGVEIETVEPLADEAVAPLEPAPEEAADSARVLERPLGADHPFEAADEGEEVDWLAARPLGADLEPPSEAGEAAEEMGPDDDQEPPLGGGTGGIPQLEPVDLLTSEADVLDLLDDSSPPVVDADEFETPLSAEVTQLDVVDLFASEADFLDLLEEAEGVQPRPEEAVDVQAADEVRPPGVAEGQEDEEALPLRERTPVEARRTEYTPREEVEALTPGAPETLDTAETPEVPATLDELPTAPLTAPPIAPGPAGDEPEDIGRQARPLSVKVEGQIIPQDVRIDAAQLSPVVPRMPPREGPAGARAALPDAALLDRAVTDERLLTLLGEIETLQQRIAVDVRSSRRRADVYQRELLQASALLLQNRANFEDVRAIVYRVRADLARDEQSAADISHYGPQLNLYLVFAAVLWLVLMALEPLVRQFLANIGLEPLAAIYHPMLFGMVGAIVYAYFILHKHTVRLRDFDAMHASWYLMNPLVGAIMGLLMALVFSAAVASIHLGAAPTSRVIGPYPFLLWALCFLAGFYQNVILRLLDRAFGFLRGGRTDTISTEHPPTSS